MPSLFHKHKNFQISPTETELSFLPQYCQIRLGNQFKTMNKEMYGAFNQRFPDIHHHCSGLNYLNRARGTIDLNQRRFLLRRAVGELNYCLRKWPQNHPLRQEAEMHKMQAEILQKSRF